MDEWAASQLHTDKQQQGEREKLGQHSRGLGCISLYTFIAVKSLEKCYVIYSYAEPEIHFTQGVLGRILLTQVTK